MTTSSSPESEKPAGVLETAKQTKEIFELVTWVIGLGTASLSFLQTPGSLTGFLIEVGTYGFACYAAIWVILPVALLLVEYLNNKLGRETTDTATAVIVGVAVLGGGVLIKSTFAPGVYHDLDAIGTAFSVLMGLGTLAVPVFLLWYLHGSKPRTT